ncbi:hypothetical protein [Glutamicibacter sp. NPDC127525]|uniref:hypothetical protein n=1 Tax=unclassified Glutamicibacter TaxID=2627139 RepID=UPI003629E536
MIGHIFMDHSAECNENIAWFNSAAGVWRRIDQLASSLSLQSVEVIKNRARRICYVPAEALLLNQKFAWSEHVKPALSALNEALRVMFKDHDLLMVNAKDLHEISLKQLRTIVLRVV